MLKGLPPNQVIPDIKLFLISAMSFLNMIVPWYFDILTKSILFHSQIRHIFEQNIYLLIIYSLYFHIYIQFQVQA
jgi:hypothetical protein